MATSLVNYDYSFVFGKKKKRLKIIGVPHLYFNAHKIPLPEGPGLAAHPFSKSDFMQ